MFHTAMLFKSPEACFTKSSALLDLGSREFRSAMGCRQLETEIAVLGTRACMDHVMIIRILPITALSPTKNKNKNIKSTQDYSFWAISDGPI